MCDLPRRLLKRWIVLALAVAFLGVAGRGYWLFRSDPEHWQHRRAFIETSREEDLVAMANHVESQVLKLQSYQGPLPGQAAKAVDTVAEDPSLRRVHMTLDEANAWLTTKLDQWLANRGVMMPSHLSRPTIHVDDGEMVISALLDAPQMRKVISTTLDIEIMADGLLRIERQSIRWGRLPVPLSFVEELFGQHTSPQRRALLDDVTRMTNGEPQDPRIPYLGDRSRRRMMRLLAIDLRDDEIDLTFRIEDAEEGQSP